MAEKNSEEIKNAREEAKAAQAEKEQVQAELESKNAEIEALKAEIEAMKNEEKKTADANAAAEDAKAKRRAYLNEKVSRRLFRDGDKYKDDVIVIHNGKSYLIRRGEDVKIPRKIAMILDQSQAQDEKTAKTIAEKSAEFADEAKKVGV